MGLGRREETMCVTKGTGRKGAVVVGMLYSSLFHRARQLECCTEHASAVRIEV